MTSISILIGAIALCCVPVTPFSFNYAAWKIALPFFGTSVLDRKRSDLKKSLIDACKENMNAQKKRLRIESILDELAGTQSDSATAASPLLRKTWNLYVPLIVNHITFPFSSTIVIMPYFTLSGFGPQKRKLIFSLITESAHKFHKRSPVMLLFYPTPLILVVVAGYL
jgi:hypothetical protein